MATQTTARIGMPLDEFNRLQAEQPFELLHGERIDRMPNPWIHSWIIRLLFRVLDRWCTEHQLGEVFQETTYATVEGSAWVKGSRIPDLMVFAPDRVQAYLESIERAPNMPFAIAPDLTIEVLSASETATEINKKVTVDLEQGVRLIWIVDPMQQTVHEYSGDQVRRLLAEDHLDGRDVLPGFRLALADLFAEAR